MNGTTIAQTDLGNSERLIGLHGDDLRYVGAWGRWLAFDGKRWCEDESGGAMRCAVDTSRTLVAEALAALDLANRLHAASASPATEEEKKKAEAQFKHAVQTQGAKRLEAMLSLARSNASVAVSHDKLDADPWLLNVSNGTIDLRTGELRQHRRADLITKLAPVEYQPKAKCPTWDKFIAQVMDGNQELVSYLGRIIGYALTGSTREHVLAFCFGGGANGKTTFLGTIHAMLGDYAAPAPRGLLFRSRGERHPTELAALHGRRFVTCPEIESGQAFDEALVKDLTGGDLIAARRMREDYWHYTPTHKLFIAGNHKPTVRGDDEGIWRRVRLMPWTVTIPEPDRDKMLPEKLKSELPGILAWAVRGCIEWQKSGLGDPPAVIAATAEYREESDTLGDFFRSQLTFAPDESVARFELRDAYKRWCEEQGYDSPIGPKAFAARLRARGVEGTTVRRGAGVKDGWRGVRLATDAEREAAVVWRRDLQRADPVKSDRTRAREQLIPDRDPTSHYDPTGEQEHFADYLEREGVGNG